MGLLLGKVCWVVALCGSEAEALAVLDALLRGMRV